MSQMHTPPSDLAFDLIDRLHKSLRLSGMNATSLADALGVHRNTVNNYLSGRSPIKRRDLLAWAQVTGVPVRWLEHGIVVEDEPDPDGGVPVADVDDNVAQLAARKRAKTRRRSTDGYLDLGAAA